MKIIAALFTSSTQKITAVSSWLKPFGMFVKYVIIPCSTLVGFLYALDTYVVNRALTAVKPVAAKVEMLVPTVNGINQRTINIENVLMNAKIIKMDPTK